ncbi:MAG: PIG-L deacetylase family protein [Hyphomicrobiaceae bacterium]
MQASFEQFCQRTGLRRSLLVVAPHPDDETIGCGGLLALAGLAGMHTVVVVLTDGAASHPGSRTWPAARIADQRKREATRAAEILAVSEPPLFLGLPDSRTQMLHEMHRRSACQQLAAALLHHRAEVVLTTWRREPHCDHRFAYELTRDAVRGAATGATIVEYIVWADLIGAPDDRLQPGEMESLELDISTVRARKRVALAAHRSQLGRLIRDDPAGFNLTRAHLKAMTGGFEHYALPRS